ncbi:MAG: ATP-dependent RecD-like DNA helicase [Desulfobacterales bacterium]
MDVITLTGILERITYYDEESRFLIARLRADETEKPVTIMGYMAGVHPGESLKISGKWATHPKYGRQFKVSGYEVVLPATLAGIKRYLASGMIEGIGAKTAERLIRHFAEKALEVIDQTPERLTEVEGIGQKTANRIAEAWQSHHEIRVLMDFLQQCGVDLSQTPKLITFYGAGALDAIRKSPYRISADIPDVDFFTMDMIAKALGYDDFCHERIAAAIDYVVGRFVSEGHTYMPESLLKTKLKRQFQMDAGPVEDALAAMVGKNQLITEPEPDPADERRIYTPVLHEAEIGIARRINALLSVPVAGQEVNPRRIADEMVEKIAVRPSAEQLAVLEGILAHRFAVITGGPGTGKTTLIRAVTAMFDALGKRVLLSAPTGRAARRLSEVTGRNAETIHKMLRYNPAVCVFEKNRDDPLDADAIVVDEASMVDTVLMFNLVNAVSPYARLILVGDVFQLPSIGPGNVLSDLIRSTKITTFELTKIHRQAHRSPIVLAAHKIRRGEMPDIGRQAYADSDFLFIEQERPEAVVELIIDLVTRVLPERMERGRIQDVQVITPMHKGTVGTLSLNRILQKAVNPASNENRIPLTRFRVNDKVMHLKNNYQKEVFNGDIGLVCGVEEQTGKIRVNYEDRIVDYAAEETDELALAYAITVHKSQGSEYPAVVIPLLTQHYIMLQRNLLYTAVTRGRDATIVIGTPRALQSAISNDRPRQRLTGLAERLAVGAS